MTTSKPGTLIIALGNRVEAGTPLGPLEGTPLSGFSPSSGNGRLHAVADCSRLAKAPTVHPVRFALTSDSLARLCSNGRCRWEVPGDGHWPAFLDALDALSRLRIDEEEVEPTLEETEIAEAVHVLSLGEYPQEEECGDAWRRYEEAWRCRDEWLARWQDAQDRLATAAASLDACPWLRQWAAAHVDVRAAAAEKLRLTATRFYVPKALADAAAVDGLPAPALPPDGGFGIFGDQASSVMSAVWRAWCASATTDARPLSAAALSAEEVLYEALGRRRNGVDEAKQSLQRLTDTWAAAARLAAAEQTAGRPWCLIGVRVPPRPLARRDGSGYQALTSWQLAVIAVYQVTADWHRAVVALWVPQGIGHQLLTAAPSLRTVDLLGDTEDWAAPASTLLAAWEPDRHDARVR
ncbi:hypothetical protein RI138_23730 [Streptomyces sp. C11-1]|uniref:Uncharacterized protein n=1 Tax=Streptomyces durocortorensis TaxID=2811104 RepID=A0ABY9W3Z2_9ACTN|nr:hypothetical protein [Streptomyces durocortorensis]WNF29590.1 hypothetical protein RI138_23730 [Streptomyces durocortorensis]